LSFSNFRSLSLTRDDTWRMLEGACACA
jgi:hypothetical protein